MIQQPQSLAVPVEGSVYFGGALHPGLLDQLPTPIIYCRLLYRDGQPEDFRYLYANPAFSQNFRLQDVVGRTSREIAPNASASRRPIMQFYKRVAQSGKPEKFDVYAEAYRKWMTVQVSSPAPDHFIAVFTSVGERVSGDRLRSTFEAMAEGFYVRNREGDVIDSNPAAERILGVSTDFLRTPGRPRIGRGFREDGTEVPRPEWPSIRTLNTGQPLRNQVMGIELGPGLIRWVSFNTQPIGGKPGRPEYVVTTFVDITERIRAEQQRLATLESMNDGYLALDEHWCFRYLNAAAERMLRVQRDAMIGRNQWERYPETLGTVVELRYRETAAGRPTTFDYEDARTRRCVNVRCFPREGGGIDVFFTETTEARDNRVALAQSNEDLRRLVGQMNAVEADERLRIAREIHDELQQSLAAVRLEIGSILKVTEQDGTEVGALARSAARHLTDVIESTRRIIRDLRPPELDAVGLSAALESMLERARKVHGLQVALNTQQAPGAASLLSADVTYCLYRIAQEALNNVCKHAQARKVELCLDLSVAYQVVLTVRDDGRGVRQEDLRKDGSFGVLGMRERVMALGGGLAVTASPKGGTLVSATLPLGC